MIAVATHLATRGGLALGWDQLSTLVGFCQGREWHSYSYGAPEFSFFFLAVATIFLALATRMVASWGGFRSSSCFHGRCLIIHLVTFEPLRVCSPAVFFGTAVDTVQLLLCIFGEDALFFLWCWPAIFFAWIQFSATWFLVGREVSSRVVSSLGICLASQWGHWVAGGRTFQFSTSIFLVVRHIHLDVHAG